MGVDFSLHGLVLPMFILELFVAHIGTAREALGVRWRRLISKGKELDLKMCIR